MHVAMVMGTGLLLLCVFAMFGWLWGASLAGVALAAKCFVPAWLVVASVNMWVGTTHGYTVRQEAPILLLVFAVPAAVALVLAWRLSRG
jgi:hypothetical protein